MAAGQDDLLTEEPPSSINPYQVLEVDEKASAEQIKSAYRKQALKHHPDKAPPESKDEANKKFQEIAFAYAILSDERRRRRYDATGNTSESLDLEDDDFDWVDFYREQFSTMVDGKAIEKIKAEYQCSEEEKADLLEAYETFEGNLDKVYQEVMLSNVLDDDDRFRKIIDDAIRAGEASDWPKYSKEDKKKKAGRVKAAQREAEEARELAKELGVEDKLFGSGKSKGSNKGTDNDDGALMALIQQRQKDRGLNFLANIEAKYAKPSTSGKKGKKRSTEESEPSEEAFQKNRSRTTKKQKAGAK